jgi:hypothetical protein
MFQPLHRLPDVRPHLQLELVRLFRRGLRAILDVGAVLGREEALDAAGLLGPLQQADLRLDDVAADAADDGVEAYLSQRSAQRAN